EILYMATLHSAESSRFIYVKGAPEKILSMCASILTEKGEILLNEAILEKIHHSIGDLTEKSLRMIAVAYSEISTAFGSLTEEMFEGKLVFVGMFGMMDPPRKEVVQAIQHCKEAGIRVVMITGDNPLTAKAIAKELGIVFPKVMTGDELRNLDEGAFEKQVKDISVFARVEPLQKLQIVTALKSQGEIVAMTGDGVNDAPALEAANIGIAMGITGTDVAKEAADMILADDRFDSIVAAVEEGRAIFNRLRNVCTFLITACFGELFGLILSVSFLGVAPLTPLQILWINLISGSIIAIPLGFEPKIGNEMKSPPRNVKSRLLYRGMIYRVGFLAICLGLGSFFVFDHTMKIASLEKARTMVLCSVIAFEWLIALKMRSQEFSLRKIGFFANPLLLYAIGSALVLHLIIIYTPFLGRLFALEPLTFNEWLLAIAPGGIIFFLETLRKELFPKLFNER
ncbi:MAG: HAD-IC family P-type ATPase, partial [Chlamydiae bacterium]|nr:HAD-IC family P-type ATPase [Chlamydiota bacterium]